jgi:hypothetical protein
VQGLGCVHSDPQGGTLPEDSVRREANCANNERWHAWKQRRWLRSAAQAVVRAQGEETLSKSESSRDDEEEEGEVISSPCALSLKIIPPTGDLFDRQAGILASAGQVKCPLDGRRWVVQPTATVWPHASTFCHVRNALLYLPVHA